MSAALLLLAAIATPDLAGKWHGSFSPGAAKVEVFLTLSKTGTGWTGSARSPQLGGEAPLADLSVDGGAVSFRIPEVGVSYTGRHDPAADQIVGEIRRKSSLKLVFSRGWQEEAAVRIQTPKPPFPYRESPFTVTAADGAKLAGTLTEPEGATALVIFASGAGPQDRDQTVLGHKSFAVLADQLARRGIATLRTDDRGVGDSSGSLEAAGLDRLASDLFEQGQAAAKGREVVYLGFSQGCATAALAARRTGARAVLLSPIAFPGLEVLSKTRGKESLAALMAEAAEEKSLAEARLALARSNDAAKTEALEILSDQSSLEILSFNLCKELKGTASLAVLGKNDLTYQATEAARKLRGLPGVKVELRKGLNHLLQPAESNDPAVIQRCKVTLDPSVIRQVCDWVQMKKA